MNRGSGAAHRNPEYKSLRIELKRVADKLIQLANAMNLDGAAFTYTRWSAPASTATPIVGMC